MIQDKLKEKNIKLPAPPNPAGSYIPIKTSGRLAFVSGQIPVRDGKVVYCGKVPHTQSVESAQEASKLCIINALSQLNAYFGTLDNISQIIRISGFVNSAPDFFDHPKIINAEIFGDAGKHSRVAVGVSSLPLDSTVEIDMIVEINN